MSSAKLLENVLLSDVTHLFKSSELSNSVGQKRTKTTNTIRSRTAADSKRKKSIVKSTGEKRVRTTNAIITSNSKRKRIANSTGQKRVRTTNSKTNANSTGQKKSRATNTNTNANSTVQKKAQATSVNALANDMNSMTLGEKQSLTNNNEKTLIQDIQRTPCRKHLKKLKKLKEIFSVLNGVNYVQGYHYIALQLLRNKSVQSAYKIFGSEGMKRFLMLKPEVRPKLMRSLSPLFPGLKPLQKETDRDVLLLLISVDFAQEFYINNEACKHKLLNFLLSPARTLNYENDVSFFQERDSFTMFYLFILRHLSIVITETMKQRKLTSNEKHDHKAFISKNNIEAKTIESVKGHIEANDLEHYKSHCLAAFTVMLLDNPFGNIGNNSIEAYLKGAQQLIHVTNLPGPNSKSQSLNLQGIKPFWGPPVNIPVSTVKRPLFIKFLPPIFGKLLMAYMMIYEHLSYEGVKRMLEYFESVVYVDTDGKVISLLDALKDKTKKDLRYLALLPRDPKALVLVRKLLQLI